MSYLVTMQSQKSYETKTKRVASEMEANNFLTRAISTAQRVIYDDAFDGMDAGLIRAIRLQGNSAEYVLTIHRH